MTKYDVHAHCIPEELLDMLRADGPQYGIEVVADDRGDYAVIAGRVRLAPFRSILGDTEARLAAMDAGGVDVQVISSWVDLTAYALEPERGAAERVGRDDLGPGLQVLGRDPAEQIGTREVDGFRRLARSEPRPRDEHGAPRAIADDHLRGAQTIQQRSHCEPRAKG